MKKKFLLGLFLLFVISLVSCGDAKESSQESSMPIPSESKIVNEDGIIDILTINDTHGYLESDSTSSITNIAGYMNHYQDSIKIAVGDMFQGSGISNMSKGRAMIDVMNEIGFDCMVLGNHEFDWGIGTILKYFDGDQLNGEANFPLLAANVIDSNGNPLAYAKPYTIIQRGSYKIGVIGVIGETLESSISVSSLEGHEFLPARPIVEQYTSTLRNVENCDMVILAAHVGSSFNSSYSGLDIDLILNGHTHVNETGTTSQIPYLQAGCNAKYVGHITADLKNDKIDSYKVITATSIYKVSKSVKEIVDRYVAEFAVVLESEVAKISNYSKTGLVRYACKTYEEYFEADFAFVNYGGFRTNWNKKTSITYNDMMTMIPFDNQFKTCYMSGKLIKELAGNLDTGYIGTSQETKFVGSDFYIGNTKIEDDKIYFVVAIDYIFDKEEMPFLSGTDINETGCYMRDVLLDKLIKEGYADFSY